MKKFITVTAAALIALSMAACGSSKPAESAAAPAASESAAPASAAPSESAAPAASEAAPSESAAPAASEAAPAAGALKDGTYKAEMTDFDASTGYKDFVEVTVAGGKITAVNWDAVNKDSSKANKKIAATNGSYDMVSAGAKSSWDVQAKDMEAAVIASQDATKIAVGSDGKTDAVSGVSIHVADFLKLAQQAIDKAK